MPELESKNLGSEEYLYLTDWGIYIIKCPQLIPGKKGENPPFSLTPAMRYSDVPIMLLAPSTFRGRGKHCGPFALQKHCCHLAIYIYMHFLFFISFRYLHIDNHGCNKVKNISRKKKLRKTTTQNNSRLSNKIHIQPQETSNGLPFSVPRKSQSLTELFCILIS